MAAWRVIVGDLLGHPIANLSAVALDKSITPRFGRPDSFTLRVPSDHPEVGKLHTDGFPKVEKGIRTLRAFRREWVPAASAYQYVIRHAGIIWTIQDTGDENAAWTTLTSFAPMQRLAGRFTGVDTADRVGDAAQLAKALVDTTNALGYTGIATTGSFPVSTSRTVNYQNQAIGDALVDLATAYNSFDLDFAPVYQLPGTEDGTLVVMSCLARKGSYRPNAALAWGLAPHNIAKVDRNGDCTGLANVLTGTGGGASGADQLTSVQTNAASLALFGRYENVVAETDVSDQGFLDSLTLSAVGVSAWPTDTVNLTPATAGEAAGRVPRPWQDFDIGDTVDSTIGAKLRGGYNGQVRIYGYTVNISQEGEEQVSNIVTSAQGVS